MVALLCVACVSNTNGRQTKNGGILLFLMLAIDISKSQQRENKRCALATMRRASFTINHYVSIWSVLWTVMQFATCHDVIVSFCESIFTVRPSLIKPLISSVCHVEYLSWAVYAVHCVTKLSKSVKSDHRSNCIHIERALNPLQLAFIIFGGSVSAWTLTAAAADATAVAVERIHFTLRLNVSPKSIQWCVYVLIQHAYCGSSPFSW